MDQQGERVSLGGGGGGPMDQQQRVRSRELATVTDVLPGQGVGAGAPLGVCLHLISFDRKALSAGERGAFRVMWHEDNRACRVIPASIIHEL